MALEPRRRVADEREAGRVAFREAILAESADLLDDALGELLRDALGRHPGDQPPDVPFHVSVFLPRGHVAAELVCFAGRVVGGYHGKAHHLLLKDGHAEGLLQHGAKRRMWIRHGLLACPATQVRVHHPSADRPRPYDAHLDDEVVVRSRFQARQHGHLCARLSIWNTPTVSPLHDMS